MRLLFKVIGLFIIILLLFNIIRHIINNSSNIDNNSYNIEFEDLTNDYKQVFQSNERNNINIWYGNDWMKVFPFKTSDNKYTMVSDVSRFNGHNVISFIISNPNLLNKIKYYSNISYQCKDYNEPDIKNSKRIDNSNIASVVTKDKESLKYTKWARSVGLSSIYVGYRRDNSDDYIDITWRNSNQSVKEFQLNKNNILLTTSLLDDDVKRIMGTAIVIQHFEDGNIFHQFKNSGILFYILSQFENMKNITVIMDSNIKELKSSQLWMEAAVSQIITVLDTSKYPAKSILVFDEIYRLEPVTIRNNIIFSHFMTLNQNPVKSMIKLRNELISKIPSISSDKKYILLLYRHPRYIMDHNTRLFSTIVEEICKLGLNVKVENFELKTPQEQQQLFRNAAVVIAVHGSELTNLIYLDPSSVVIEITLRYGWCCDPIPLKNQGFYSDPCTNNCRPYHKWDFINLAHSLNLKYFYFDPVYIDPPYASNPIARNEVHINSKELALLVFISKHISNPNFNNFHHFLNDS